MTTPADPTDDRTWTVVVNMPVWGGRGKNAWTPVGWQSLNNLPDNRFAKMKWSKAKKRWRVAAYSAIVNARVPQHLGRIEVDIELRFTTNQTSRNAENFEQTIKPVIDALGQQRIYNVTDKKTGKEKQVIEVGWNVVDGDDERYLVRAGRVRIGPKLERGHKAAGQVILTIRRIPAVAEEAA